MKYKLLFRNKTNIINKNLKNNFSLLFCLNYIKNEIESKNK